VRGGVGTRGTRKSRKVHQRFGVEFSYVTTISWREDYFARHAFNIATRCANRKREGENEDMRARFNHKNSGRTTSDETIMGKKLKLHLPDKKEETSATVDDR